MHLFKVLLVSAIEEMFGLQTYIATTVEILSPQIKSCVKN